MVTGILLYLAFIRLLHSDYHIEGGAMLLTASIAVCANMLYVPVWSGHQVGSRVRERVFFQDGNTHARLHTSTHCLLWVCLKRSGKETLSQAVFVEDLLDTSPTLPV